MSTELDLQRMLTRMESRIVRGFSELGVDVQANSDWLTVVDGTIYITSLGRSLQAMQQEARRQGALIGTKKYDVIYAGKWVATI